MTRGSSTQGFEGLHHGLVTVLDTAQLYNSYSLSSPCLEQQ